MSAGVMIKGKETAVGRNSDVSMRGEGGRYCKYCSRKALLV